MNNTFVQKLTSIRFSQSFICRSKASFIVTILYPNGTGIYHAVFFQFFLHFHCLIKSQFCTVTCSLPYEPSDICSSFLSYDLTKEKKKENRTMYHLMCSLEHKMKIKKTKKATYSMSKTTSFYFIPK